MATVDWSVGAKRLRKQLLTLTKPKLIKACKHKKVSTVGSKNDLVDRLLKVSKKTKKKKKVNKIQTPPQPIIISSQNDCKKPIDYSEQIINKQNKINDKLRLYPYSEDRRIRIEWGCWRLWHARQVWKTVGGLSFMSIQKINQKQLQTLTYNQIEYKQPQTPQLQTKAKKIEKQSIKPSVAEMLIFGLSRNYTSKIMPAVDIIKIMLSYLGVSCTLNPHFDEYKKINIGDGYDEEQEYEGNVIGIVISINSRFIQVGYAGNDHPLIDIAYHDILQNASPIENGQVVNWNVFKQILMKITQHVTSSNEKLAVLMGISSTWGKHDIERITQIMFDEIGCFAFYIQPNVLLCLYASRETTGSVIYSDYHHTEIVLIYSGEWGSGYWKKHDYVLKLGKRDVITWRQKQDKLKNNKHHDIDEDALDILFHPKLFLTERNDFYAGSDGGIHECLYETVMGCKSDLRAEMYASVVLAGINTTYSNIADRFVDEFLSAYSSQLENEYQRRTYSYANTFDICEQLKVIALPNSVERNELAWLGGSILSGLDPFGEMWITKEEYDETGPSIVYNIYYGPSY